jgi:hypothetical protein
MKGYVRQRGDRYYALIYEGRGPVTGKEQRTWHPAGTDRDDAERLATKLAATETDRVGAVRVLTFGAYLTGTSCPACKPTPPELPKGSPDPFPARRRDGGNPEEPTEEHCVIRRSTWWRTVFNSPLFTATPRCLPWCWYIFGTWESSESNPKRFVRITSET